MRVIGFLFAFSAVPAFAAISSSDLAKYFDVAKIDFAKLEHDKPLDQNFLRQLTAEDILALNQELVDQLYARLAAGPVPDGVYEGTAKILDGSGLKNVMKTFTQFDVSQLLNVLTSHLWSGKHFFKSEHILRNVIHANDVTGRTLGILVKGFDYKSLKTTSVFIRGSKINAWEIFPAKLYCGQSLIDSRRESVVIDYAYGDKVQGYNPSIDFLATREAFYIRDEIRMVHPGLYLGKAYLNRMSFLTFVLRNPEEEKNQGAVTDWAGMQECWIGTQKVSAL